MSDHADICGGLDEVVLREMERQGIPGVGLGVFRDGLPFHVKGYGEANVELAVKVHDRTMFQSGSIGKMFTAAGVLLLVEDGLVALDDPVGHYLPGFPAAWRSITVRHLLTHTSGLSDLDYDLQRPYRDQDLLDMFYRWPAAAAPGTRWEYCNCGYAMAGILIGQVTGRPYGDLLASRIFRPTGMLTARVMSEQEIVQDRAAGYERVDGHLRNQTWVSPSLTTADGSLYLSLHDYARWDLAVNQGGVLQPRSWKEALSPVRLADGSSYPYGLGWELDSTMQGQAVIGHDGAWQGFVTSLRRFQDDRVTFVVLANIAACDTLAILGKAAARFSPSLRLAGMSAAAADR